MTRTTVYRYFPNQESLLLELSITASVDEIDDLLADRSREPPHRTDYSARRTFNRKVAANETVVRTAQRHYLDTWLAAERAGEGHAQQLREGRRHQWISAALEPLATPCRMPLCDDSKRRSAS